MLLISLKILTPIFQNLLFKCVLRNIFFHRL